MADHTKYLYRALRKEEIGAGNILIPKSQDTFSRPARFGIDMRFPIELHSETNAVRQHQWKQKGLPTSGISTTPHLERAKNYNKNGVIVKIDRHSLTKFGIKEYDVDKYLILEDIACPEDDETILVNEDRASFPKEIIQAVLKLTSDVKYL